MSSTDPRSLMEPAGARVRDPVSGRSVWLAGMMTDGRIEGESLKFNLVFTQTHSRDDRARIQEALRANLQEQGWAGEVVINVKIEGVSRKEPEEAPAPKKEPVRGMSGPGMQPHGGPINLQPIKGVKHIIAVASGKGGVGKSTVATNLACALADAGHLVGLMDADIYGPSLPIMMGVHGKPMAGGDGKILPLMAWGVKVMSIGFLVDENEPIIWRGPMVMGVVRQFLQDVAWAPVDYLVVDLPPGTGDAQLTMIQNVPISGSVIVTTPQDVALLDAVRGVEMFRKLEVPVLGVVENMSWLDLPGGGRVHPFGQGGGQKMADKYSVELLAQVPLVDRIREGGDQGSPAVSDLGSAARPIFQRLAAAIHAKLPV